MTNLQSTKEAVNFTITIHGFYSQDTIVNQMTFQRIFLPGGSLLDSVGKPELPYYSTLLAIPACDSIQFKIQPVDSTALSGYNIFPTPKIQYDSIIKDLVMTFFMDPDAYSQNDFSPVNTCTTGKAGALRDQLLGRLNFYPIKVNPIAQQLFIYKQTNVKITFVNPSTDINTDVGLFGNIANKTLLNYSLNSRHAKEVDNPNITGTVSWITSLTNAYTISADYVIITDPQFFYPNDTTTPLYKFAKYRSQHNNYDVAIISAQSARF